MANNSRGRKVRGASTISQQVAKNLFLWGGRSYVRKALEAWYTVLIELLWPKQRILEVYANIAEFGDGVYGAEAAAQRYLRQVGGAAQRRGKRAPGGGAAQSQGVQRQEARAATCSAARAGSSGRCAAWAAPPT